jgi:hypothetical protein
MEACYMIEVCSCCAGQRPFVPGGWPGAVPTGWFVRQGSEYVFVPDGNAKVCPGCDGLGYGLFACVRIRPKCYQVSQSIGLSGLFILHHGCFMTYRSVQALLSRLCLFGSCPGYRLEGHRSGSNS